MLSDKVFEKVPFGDEVGSWKHLPYKTSPEKDTELEYELAIFLNDWVEHPAEQIANKLKKYEKIFQDAKSKFPKVFMPPMGETVYRGMFFPGDKVIAWMKKAYKDGTLKTKKIGGVKHYTSSDHFSYRSFKEVSSWSTDIEVALNFSEASSSPDPKNISIIIDTVVDNSFIFNPVFMDKIYDDVIGNNSWEHETVCFKKQMKVGIHVEELSLKEFINSHYNK